jgi:hypothetical protein
MPLIGQPVPSVLRLRLLKIQNGPLQQRLELLESFLDLKDSAVRHCKLTLPICLVYSMRATGLYDIIANSWNVTQHVLGIGLNL